MESRKRQTIIFEEILFTKTIKRFPFARLDKTPMDKYVPADDLQGQKDGAKSK